MVLSCIYVIFKYISISIFRIGNMISADQIRSYSRKHLEVIFKSNQNIPYDPLSIQQLDQKLKNILLDIHSMSILLKQIKNNLFSSAYPLKTYQKFSIRFLMLINQIFEMYGIDKFTFMKVTKYIKICNAQWKKLLQKAILKVNKASINEIFLYKINRNNYIYSMLKTNNTILLKMMDRLLLKNYFNKAAIKYLKQSTISKSYQHIYSKIIFILGEKQQQTGLKILLINQFLKFILFYLNLCLKQSQFQDVFVKFFTIVILACRYIKKMQREIRSSLITQYLRLIRQGLNYYIAILKKKNKKNSIKIEQLKCIVQIIEGTSSQHRHQHSVPAFQPQNSVAANQHQHSVTAYQQRNAMPIRVGLRILDCWKSVWINGKHACQANELIEMARVQKKIKVQQPSDQQRKVARSLFQRKQGNNQQKMQGLRINKSINNLKRKSLSTKHLGDIRAQDYPLSQLKGTIKTSSNCTSKNQLLEESFQKIDNMKLFKNYLVNDKHLSKAVKQNEIRQLKIQDYQVYRQNRNKSLKNGNKIVLFKGSNMLISNKQNKKLKLSYKGTMRQLQ